MSVRDPQLTERPLGRRREGARRAIASLPASRRPEHPAWGASEAREQAWGVGERPVVRGGKVLGDGVGEPALPRAPVRFKRVASLVGQP